MDNCKHDHSTTINNLKHSSSVHSIFNKTFAGKKTAFRVMHLPKDKVLNIHQKLIYQREL